MHLPYFKNVVSEGPMLWVQGATVVYSFTFLSLIQKRVRRHDILCELRSDWSFALIVERWLYSLEFLFSMMFGTCAGSRRDRHVISKFPAPKSN